MCRRTSRQTQSHPASGGQPVRHVGDDGGNRIHAAPPARPADASGGGPLGRAEGDREARALVRQHPLGRELVVMVGQDIAWSRLDRGRTHATDTYGRERCAGAPSMASSRRAWTTLAPSMSRWWSVGGTARASAESRRQAHVDTSGAELAVNSRDERRRRATTATTGSSYSNQRTLDGSNTAALLAGR